MYVFLSDRLGYMFRLTGGEERPEEGRVEVFFDSEWRTICSRGWTEYFADAVCKHLGYRGVRDNGWSLSAQEGSGPVVCAEIFALGVCPSGGEACSHSDDVGIRCERDEDQPGSDGDEEMRGKQETLQSPDLMEHLAGKERVPSFIVPSYAVSCRAQS